MRLIDAIKTAIAVNEETYQRLFGTVDVAWQGDVMPPVKVKMSPNNMGTIDHAYNHRTIRLNPGVQTGKTITIAAYCLPDDWVITPRIVMMRELEHSLHKIGKRNIVNRASIVSSSRLSVVYKREGSEVGKNTMIWVDNASLLYGTDMSTARHDLYRRMVPENHEDCPLFIWLG